MERHPIENLMTTTMENIRDMVDVNTVVGDAIATADGSTVIPISRVAFGFVAGGGEYKCAKQAAELPSFAGGTGAGVSVQPMGFIVVSEGPGAPSSGASLRARGPHHRDGAPAAGPDQGRAAGEKRQNNTRNALAARLRRSNAVERGDERRRKKRAKPFLTARPRA